jgi:hypothetical protein
MKNCGEITKLSVRAGVLYSDPSRSHLHSVWTKEKHDSLVLRVCFHLARNRDVFGPPGVMVVMQGEARPCGRGQACVFRNSKGWNRVRGNVAWLLLSGSQRWGRVCVSCFSTTNNLRFKRWISSPQPPETGVLQTSQAILVTVAGWACYVDAHYRVWPGKPATACGP